MSESKSEMRRLLDEAVRTQRRLSAELRVMETRFYELEEKIAPEGEVPPGATSYVCDQEVDKSTTAEEQRADGLFGERRKTRVWVDNPFWRIELKLSLLWADVGDDTLADALRWLARKVETKELIR